MGMPKYDRLLYILNLLRSRKNLNASAIAKECNVTERSIYRDIISLSEANIPIYYDNGYKLASDNFLPPLNLDIDEYNFLKLTIESTPLNTTGKNSDLIKKIKAKLDANVPTKILKESKFARPSTYIDIPISNISNEQQENNFLDIEKAIEECKQVEIKYHSIKSEITDRIVEPYFIIFKGKSFYLVAFCHLRGKFRTFRLSRIMQVEILENTFFRNDDVNVESYFEDSWLIYNDDPVEVVVKFVGPAVSIIKTGSHHPKEIIEEISEDEILYKVTTRGIDEIQRWIITFGQYAHVQKPDNIRENLKNIGKYFLETY
ncbi:MAG: YafY family protein [candidate division Zixibacteria bacterium]|nr:YafY family protein [candidate division Zixibacteria bacterium]